MTATDERPEVEIGRARRRKEDQRLITGSTRWTDNIEMPGLLHLVMVRSPFAHAKIVSVDKAAAEQAPNVVAVLSGADVADEPGHDDHRLAGHRGPGVPAHPPIAVDEVVFAGEVVAVVVARSAAAARDAAELVEVDYDELPAVLDARAAAEGGDLAHSALGATSAPSGQLDSAGQGSGTAVDDEIAQARENGIVIEREYRQQRLIPAFMEPRSVVCRPHR